METSHHWSLLHIHGLRLTQSILITQNTLWSSSINFLDDCFFFHQVANIIYLDQPVDTGFSYSRNPLANIPSDTRSAKLVHEFVHKVKEENCFKCFFLNVFVHRPFCGLVIVVG